MTPIKCVGLNPIKLIWARIEIPILVSEQAKPDSFIMALEYNFFIPLFFGPWHIYPFFRKDRETQGLSWTFLDICKSFGKIFAMGFFIELYLHCFPFIAVGFDKQDRLPDLKKIWITYRSKTSKWTLWTQDYIKLVFYQTIVSLQ